MDWIKSNHVVYGITSIIVAYLTHSLLLLLFIGCFWKFFFILSDYASMSNSVDLLSSLKPKCWFLDPIFIVILKEHNKYFPTIYVMVGKRFGVYLEQVKIDPGSKKGKKMFLQSWQDIKRSSSDLDICTFKIELNKMIIERLIDANDKIISKISVTLKIWDWRWWNAF